VSARLLRALERFLLPNACVVCGAPAPAHDPDQLVCGVCRSRLRALPAGCARCRQPLPPVGPCRFCRDWPPELASAWSAVWLDDPARIVVHHLKYDGLASAGRDIARIVARRGPPPAHGVLVPVPLGTRRLRARGFNQAAAIAAALGVEWRLAVDDRLLVRTRETGTQTALGPAQRLGNTRGAFAARPCPGADAPPVILVDDVLTTGATLVACATALGEAGWSRVDAVTFARALPYDLRVV
jgi:predicted amidophosphoribosyltransferase